MKGFAGACVSMCRNDTSCPDNMKCCSNGCGHVCMKPVDTYNPCKEQRRPRQSAAYRQSEDAAKEASDPGFTTHEPTGVNALCTVDAEETQTGSTQRPDVTKNVRNPAANPCQRTPCSGRCAIKTDKFCDYGHCNQKAVCDSSSAKCQAAPAPGPCEAFFPSWFYNATSRRCEKFVFGGCLGNDNRFPTATRCYNQCNKTASPCTVSMTWVKSDDGARRLCARYWASD
ncbi:papilin-like [Gigantopelta aegis]|uniref:papilin-like n=1 Tax=Gigantopelta aegis TaxID=1735272 RepID=UPI001B888ACD|nr:papilin-like [Gigantopelta aegis]